MKYVYILIVTFLFEMLNHNSLMATVPTSNNIDSTEIKCLDLDKIDYFLPLRKNGSAKKIRYRNRQNAYRYYNFGDVRNIYVVDTVYIPEYKIIKYKDDYTFIVLNMKFDYKKFNFANPLSTPGCFLADGGFFLDSFGELSDYYEGALSLGNIQYWLAAEDLKEVKKLNKEYTLYDLNYSEETDIPHTFAIVFIRGKLYNWLSYNPKLCLYHDSWLEFIEDDNYYLVFVPVYNDTYNQMIKKILRSYEE